MTVRTHSHRLTVEQVEAHVAEAAWQLAAALVKASKPVAEKVAEARESPVAAEETQTEEAAVDVDVSMGVTHEEMPVEAVESPITSGVDDTIVESRGERLPATAEQ